MKESIVKILLKVEPRIDFSTIESSLQKAISQRTGIQAGELSWNAQEDGLLFTVKTNRFSDKNQAFKFFYDELFEVASAILPSFDSMKLEFIK